MNISAASSLKLDPLSRPCCLLKTVACFNNPEPLPVKDGGLSLALTFSTTRLLYHDCHINININILFTFKFTYSHIHIITFVYFICMILLFVFNIRVNLVWVGYLIFFFGKCKRVIISYLSMFVYMRFVCMFIFECGLSY